MSNLSKDAEQPCNIDDSPGVVKLVITPKDKDLGGFSVRRALPNRQCKKVGPWVFFDHMGPAQFPPGQGVNVRPHPHIHLATVTYLFAGEILHRDSLGSEQAIRPGDVNLMVAGRGIVHSERESEAVRNSSHSLEGLQLWLALPQESEDIDPAFYHYPSGEIPSVTVDQSQVRVMMGEAYNVTSPVKTFANTIYVEAHVQAGHTLLIPEAEERALYVVEGELSVDGQVVPKHAMAVIAQGPVSIEATQKSHVAVIGGEALPPRFIDWNFVSSRKECIAQAKEDWQARRFPLVPGDEEEFIPLPER